MEKLSKVTLIQSYGESFVFINVNFEMGNYFKITFEKLKYFKFPVSGTDEIVYQWNCFRVFFVIFFNIFIKYFFYN